MRTDYALVNLLLWQSYVDQLVVYCISKSYFLLYRSLSFTFLVPQCQDRWR